MTIVLHPLSHYNSITKPCARFLLSFLEGLSIDFSSHFILSFIDVYKDITTRDKLIFPSAIIRLLRHFFVSYSESTHLSFMCAINATTIRQSETQLRPKQPQTETTTPPTSSASSTSIPSSSEGGVTLEAVIAQLEHMDARLDTLTIELYQVNTHVGHIARRQDRKSVCRERV